MAEVTVIESKPRTETEVKKYITPARSRIFAAIYTGEPLLFYPDRKFGKEEIIKGLEKNRPLDLDPLVGLTWESRWRELNSDKEEVSQTEFDKQLQDWLNQTQNWINYTARGGENKVFIETLDSLAIKNIDSAAKDLYDMFLDVGEADAPRKEAREKIRDGLGFFINALIKGCIENDGPNVDKLGERLESIRPLLKIFGTELEAYKRLEDYIMVLALPKDDMQSLADIAAANQEVSDEKTIESLTALARHAGATEPGAEPAQPVSPEPSETPSIPERSPMTQPGEKVRMDGQTFMVERVEGDIVYGNILGKPSGRIDGLGDDYKWWQTALGLPPVPLDSLPEDADSSNKGPQTEGQQIINDMGGAVRELARIASEKIQKGNKLVRDAKKLLEPYIDVQGDFPHVLGELIRHNTHVPIEQLLPLPGRIIIYKGETLTITNLSLDFQNPKKSTFTLSGPSTSKEMSLEEFERLKKEEAQQSSTEEVVRDDIPIGTH